ncbi:MAG TPA: hypothetical protein VIH83_03130 [Candidatus Bathyarchaeia archaeon]
MDAPKGFLWRTIFSILALATFLIGSLVYVAFYTSGYTLFQKVAVILIALIAALTVISIVWVSWAGRRGMMRWMKW